MASRSTASLLFNPVLRSSRTISPSIFRPYPRLPRTSQPASYRFAHAIPKPPSQTPSTSPSSPSSTSSKEKRPRKWLQPHYKLTFTCVPCSHRSTHTISKQGYHKGSVLITCPSCRNRHIISDHLNIFGDRKITIEDLMREKGQLVKRGTLGETGDIEFWEDGTSADPAAVRNELDALSEEQVATIARKARNPSSQSTESPGTTSTPLGNAGARPSIRNAQYTNYVPSTRRQFSDSKKPKKLKSFQEAVDQIWTDERIKDDFAKWAKQTFPNELSWDIMQAHRREDRLRLEAERRQWKANRHAAHIKSKKSKTSNEILTQVDRVGHGEGFQRVRYHPAWLPKDKPKVEEKLEEIREEVGLGEIQIRRYSIKGEIQVRRYLTK
ncbi:DNL zinc finger-domain-containing protein [Hypoxylon sp. FL0890]|nr:DNL zinc finger-domain-containing protein [Hypoxylon sp. FL0890]